MKKTEVYNKLYKLTEKFGKNPVMRESKATKWYNRYIQLEDHQQGKFWMLVKNNYGSAATAFAKL